MTVTIKINSLIGRIALAAGLLLSGIVCAGILTSHYVIRTVADRRIVMGLDALAAAAIKLPDSPRVLFRLAETEMAEPAFNTEMLARTQIHAASAINLSPWDYRSWRLLAMAQEAGGNAEDAERSLLATAKLAPSNVEIQWILANLLLRQGKLSDSVVSFRSAVRGNAELLPTAFELLWQASNGDLRPLVTVASDDAKSQLELVQFLAEHSEIEVAANLYHNIDAREKIKFPSAASFISLLIRTGRFSTARELWLETVFSLTGGPTADLVWNGGFEIDSLKEFNHFDWIISASDYARIGFDRGVTHKGEKALKFIFAGRDTTKLEGEVKQLVVLKPSTRYRLECYAKAANLITTEGPKLALLTQNRVLAASDPVLPSSTEWQLLMTDFTSPPELSVAFVTVVRLPRFSYDEPTRGTVWFDDFKLTEL